MNAIERLRRVVGCVYPESDNARDLGAVDALYQAAKEHLTHTDRFCVDKDAEANLTCPTHRALAAAVRRVEGKCRFISDEPLNDAQMERAVKRSEREGWKDIKP